MSGPLALLARASFEGGVFRGGGRFPKFRLRKLPEIPGLVECELQQYVSNLLQCPSNVPGDSCGFLGTILSARL